MRWWLLVVVAGCASSDSESCNPRLASQLTQHVGEIASGRELIGISWSEQIGDNAPDSHAAIVAADGTLGAEIRISERHRAGTAGTTSVLWHARHERPDCRVDPFDAVLQTAGGDVRYFDLAPSTIGRTATFDGRQYQLFWITTARMLHHVAISEDGTLGPVHDLGIAGDGIPCASAASDRAGTTFVRFNNQGFLVDPSTGSTRLVWTARRFSDDGFNNSFYFAGEFHVIDYRWFSIDPASGTSRERPYPTEMKFANVFYATQTAVYGSLLRGMVALDLQLAPIATYPPSNPAFGTFGDDRVYFEQVGIDPTTLAPGHIDLSRDGATSWFHPVAGDSPVETIENCTAF